MPDLRTRPAEPDDVPEILEVLRAALGEPPTAPKTPDVFAWKHEHNPFGRSLILLAEIDGRIAGVRALLRWELETPSGDRLRCLRPVDTATHPDFGRRGVFRRLTTEAIEMARAEGVDLVFNTPNPASGAGYLSMGWQHVGWIDALVRPRLRSLREAAPDRLDLSAVVPTAVPDVPTTIVPRPARGLRTPRTPDYLAWRFSHPAVPYGWVPNRDGTGGAVVRPGVRAGHSETVLSDLLGHTEAADVRRVVRGSRAHHVAAFFSRGSPERRRAVAGSLIPAPWVKALRLVALPLSDVDLDLFDLGSWDLATSDLELL